MDLERCYEILGIKPNSRLEDIKLAYRDLVKVWHPDRFANNPRIQKKANEEIKGINYAYNQIIKYLSSEKREKRQGHTRSNSHKKDWKRNREGSESFDRSYSSENKNRKSIIEKAENYFNENHIGFFRFHSSFAFPNKCFQCGTKANKEHKLRASHTFRYYIFFLSWRTFSVPIPVCKRHYYQVNIDKLILAIFFFSLFIPVLFFAEDPSNSKIEIWGLFVLAIGVIFIISKIYTMLISSLRIHEFKTHEGKVIEVTFSTTRKELLMELCQIDGVEILFLKRPEKLWRSQSGGSFRV